MPGMIAPPDPIRDREVFRAFCDHQDAVRLQKPGNTPHLIVGRGQSGSGGVSLFAITAPAVRVTNCEIPPDLIVVSSRTAELMADAATHQPPGAPAADARRRAPRLRP